MQGEGRRGSDEVVRRGGKINENKEVYREEIRKGEGEK